MFVKRVLSDYRLSVGYISWLVKNFIVEKTTDKLLEIINDPMKNKMRNKIEIKRYVTTADKFALKHRVHKI